ncbi:hypothetical protein Dimus_036654, partial [Dionaea muscipula]
MMVLTLGFAAVLDSAGFVAAVLLLCSRDERICRRRAAAVLERCEIVVLESGELLTEGLARFSGEKETE